MQCLIAMSGFITLDTWDEICATSCVNIDAHWYRKILKGSLMSIVLWYLTRWNKHMTHICLPSLVSGISRRLWTRDKSMFHKITTSVPFTWKEVIQIQKSLNTHRQICSLPNLNKVCFCFYFLFFCFFALEHFGIHWYDSTHVTLCKWRCFKERVQLLLQQWDQFGTFGLLN